MSSFYERVGPLVERVSQETERRLRRISQNEWWIAQSVYFERMKYMFAAGELSAKEDGARVRVDQHTEPVNREEFINHLNLLAGESANTVWTTDQEED